MNPSESPDCLADRNDNGAEASGLSHLSSRIEAIWLRRSTRTPTVRRGRELGTGLGPPPVSSRYGASERALATAFLRIHP